VDGALSKGIVPGLLREIYVGRRSGWLRLVRGGERQSIRFQRGHIVNAHSNVLEDRLGEMLVRQGKLSAADLARATEIVVGEKARLGEVLTRLGLIDASGLEDAVALHVHEMLVKVFTWTEGSYQFEPEQDDAPVGELTLKSSTGELILEAVRALADPGVVREALGDMSRVLRPSDDPLLRFQKLKLSPADGFLLSRVDGATSARQVVELIPLPPEDTERSLLCLLATGAVEFATTSRRDRPLLDDTTVSGRPAPGSASTPRPPSATPTAALPSVTAPSAAPATPPAPPVAAAVAPASSAVPAARPSTTGSTDAERRSEILEMKQALATRNHFEVLGISRASGEAEVKEAYFRLARRFHPDAHHSGSLSDLRDTLETVFIQLGEVYEVLRDPRRRNEYEERLGRQRAAAAADAPAAPAAVAPARQPAPPSATKPPALDDGDRERAAEQAVRNAGGLFDKEKYWDAIQLLEPLVSEMPVRLRTRGRTLLARCYLKNPKWARRAEEVLLEVTRDDPKAVDSWALLGNIYEGKGIRTRALSMYKKALELKPDHEDASRYVLAHPPEEPQPEEDGGLLRKLFRKS
jgi:tetratricopeptide (TPR) repeat protein